MLIDNDSTMKVPSNLANSLTRKKSPLSSITKAKFSRQKNIEESRYLNSSIENVGSASNSIKQIRSPSNTFGRVRAPLNSIDRVKYIQLKRKVPHICARGGTSSFRTHNSEKRWRFYIFGTLLLLTLAALTILLVHYVRMQKRSHKEKQKSFNFAEPQFTRANVPRM